MNSGYIERTNHLGRKLYFDALGELVWAECTYCKKVKPVSEYAKSASAKYGIRSQCKECSNTFHRKKELIHEPVIYRIQLGEACYIGQTKNIEQRKEGHIRKARNNAHCKEFIEAYKRNSDEFIKAVKSMEVIKRFDKTATEKEVSEWEYSYQIELMLRGVKVLGQFDNDTKFKQFFVNKLGGVSEIIKAVRG